MPQHIVKRRRLAILCVVFSICVGGCGGSENYDAAYESSENSAESDSPTEQTGLDSLAASTPVKSARKIVYTSTIGLVVDDYHTFETELPKLIHKHGGFVANSDTDRRYQDNQSGRWIVRIPVDQYNDFLSGVNSLGFTESRSENAQDVTEEYIDLEARIENKKRLESRILTMLEEHTGKLSEVLEIERELARVREGIEMMEGRLRFLKDRTSLATITISCREEKEYEPPKPPTLLSRISSTLTSSLTSLRRTAENLLVVVIAATPWIVALALPILIMRYFAKRWWRKRKARRSA
ncbi:MAG: hypothetical protein COA78_06460 [Blastopirellula sp.]|nr:MAG: hypothetical protein COA78_06460 [Blastopirellula sp.]